jgi:hypothetical protein
MVAHIFAELLNRPGAFAGVFDEVAFAVFDRTESQVTYHAFAECFRGVAA